MPDDQFDRDLAQRLRGYESRIPDADAPRLEDSAGHHGGLAMIVAVGTLAAVTGGTFAFVLVNSAPQALGDASPTPVMTAAESPSRRPLRTAMASVSPAPASIPPLTASNGTNGTPISWCWDDACVDGSLDFNELDRYPGIGSHFSVESSRAVTHVEVTAYASADESQQLDVNNNEILLLQPEPRIVVIRAEFESGGDVSYAWRVDRNVIVGVGADHVSIVEPLVEVTPPRGPDDATVRVAYTDWEMLGLEGAALILKATDQQGTVVLDRIVSQDGGDERLPPGDYVVTAYYRACSGSCEVLDPAESFCSIDAVFGPNETYRLTVSVSQRSCESGPAE